MAQKKFEEAEVLKKKVSESAGRIEELSVEEKEVEEKIQENHDDHSEYYRSVCSDWKR